MLKKLLLCLRKLGVDLDLEAPVQVEPASRFVAQLGMLLEDAFFDDLAALGVEDVLTLPMLHGALVYGMANVFGAFSAQ